MTPKRPYLPAAASVLLITVSGRDTAGITSELTGILARHQVTLMDISQAVIQKVLSLSLMIEAPADSLVEDEILKDLLFKANELSLKLDYQKMDPALLKTPSQLSEVRHFAITLIAEQISSTSLHEVTQVLANWKINIDSIKKLSEGDFSCVEMLASSSGPINPLPIRKDLLIIAKDQNVDIALQAEGLYRKLKRLVVLDMDSTLIQSEVIDELAKEKGVYEEVSEITHQAMAGKMDYDESLRLRCAKLKGLPLQALEKVYQRIQLTPGAQDLICVLKKLGYKVAVISGGFSFIADRLKERLGIDFSYANKLEIKDSALTGIVIPPIVNAQRKADLLDAIAQQEKIGLDQVIAIGDGANDLLMLEKAGLGIAFNAKPLVREQADLALSQKNMRSILYLLGLSARDIRQALPE